MLGTLLESPLMSKGGFQPTRYVSKPSAMLMKVDNKNNQKRLKTQTRIAQSLADLKQFDDLPALHRAILEVEHVGCSNVGVAESHLQAIKRAINRRVVNAFKYKINEFLAHAPKNRAETTEVVKRYETELPPIRGEFSKYLEEDIDLAKAREMATALLRDSKMRIRECQEKASAWFRHPSAENGRRFELMPSSIDALLALFSAYAMDIEICATLCEVGRVWVEPYWDTLFDATDVEELQERRDMLACRGLEVVAMNTIQRHKNPTQCCARAMKHAARLLASLNSKLLVTVAFLEIDSTPVCRAVLEAMTAVIKAGGTSELAQYGARRLIRLYINMPHHYEQDRTLYLQLIRLESTLKKSNVKDEVISHFQSDWALQDVNIARDLFDSLETRDGGRDINGLQKLFRKMNMSVPDDKMQEQLAMIDVNKSGVIQWPEFLYLVDKWGGVRNWSIESQFNEDKLAELRQLFDRFDVDGSGDIDIRELSSLLGHFGVQAKDQQVEKMIADVDADGSGTLDWYEFLFLMAMNSEKDNVTELHRRAFELFESKEKGKVNCVEFRNSIFKLTRGTISNAEIDDVLRYINTITNSKDFTSLSYQEFVILLTM